jgi:hypothetical protein
LNIEFASKLNHFGKIREPFFFVIDYAAKHFYASALASLEKGILYRIETQTNAMENVIKKTVQSLQRFGLQLQKIFRCPLPDSRHLYMSLHCCIIL